VILTYNVVVCLAIIDISFFCFSKDFLWGEFCVCLWFEDLHHVTVWPLKISWDQENLNSFW
jgi:hypothetical protein